MTSDRKSSFSSAIVFRINGSTDGSTTRSESKPEDKMASRASPRAAPTLAELTGFLINDVFSGVVLGRQLGDIDILDVIERLENAIGGREGWHHFAPSPSANGFHNARKNVVAAILAD